ncbi:MAG: peptidoglycan DD-metalloendopeptidase family protein [Oscillospiraceae bacterium]|jgi:murein DD-endopeptidase MepM/ murein hydrolase activator NlpD
MSKLNFSKGKFSRFISSKGFYVALVVCLVGASVATWLAVDRTITGIERNNDQMLQNRQVFENPPLLEEVETKQPSIPQEPVKPKQESSVSQPSSSTSSSLSEEPSKPAVQSKTSEPQPTSPKLTYALPIKGDIIKQYSNGELVKNITLGDWRTHDGMDIYAEKGADICAAADGTVVEVRDDPLWGTVVVIDHADGIQTHYCGLHKNVAVAVGDTVLVKQAIGKLDGVPCEISDKSHLHFAMRKDGAWINPMEVFAPDQS